MVQCVLWSEKYGMYQRKYTPKTLNSDQLQHDCSTAYVISQQYFSGRFISLHIHSDKEQFGVHLNFFYFLFFNIIFKNPLNLKLLDLEWHKLWSV